MRQDVSSLSITLTGSGFTPDGAVSLTSSPPPNTSVPIRFDAITADANGAFLIRRTMECTSSDQNDGFLEVVFIATDVTSGRRSTVRENATPWICRKK